MADTKAKEPTVTEKIAVENTEVRNLDKSIMTMDIKNVFQVGYLDKTDKRYGEASKGAVKKPYIHVEGGQLLSDVYCQGQTPKGVDIRFFVGQASFKSTIPYPAFVIHDGNYTIEECRYVKEGEIMESETREDWEADRDIIFGKFARCNDRFDV